MRTGFINVNKPSGVSSGYAVNKIKKLAGMPCGHMGTLDPLASGVLPVAIGNAARLFEYMLEKRKRYIAVFRFGVNSDTLDSTGELDFSNPFVPSEEALKEAAHAQVGEILQVPPRYSAKSVNGVRGYRLARAGKEFELPPKRVNIYSVELSERVSEDSFRFAVECGGGTYIRSLARDIAAACGANGIMTELVRTQSGAFRLEDAVPLDALTADNLEDYIVETESVVDLPTIDVEDRRIFNGLSRPTDRPDGLYKIYDGGAFYGIAAVQSGRVKIRTKLC